MHPKKSKARYMAEAPEYGFVSITPEDFRPELEPQPEKVKRKKKQRQKVRMAGEAGALVLSVPAGAYLGFEAANGPLPLHESLAYGVDASIRLSNHPGLRTDIPGSIVQMPHANIHTGIYSLPGVHIGANLDPLASASDLSHLLAYYLTNFQGGVLQPIHDAVQTHLETGAAAGAGTLTALTAAAIYERRRNRKVVKKRQDQIEILSGNPLDERGHAQIEDMKKGLERRIKRRKWAGRILGSLAAAAVGTGIVHNPLDDYNTPPPKSATHMLSSIITNSSPDFKGASATGFEGQAINTVAFGVVEQATNVNEEWQAGEQAETIAYNQFASGAGKELLNNPNEMPLEIISDMHCNIPAETIYEPVLDKQIKAPIVLDLGDTQTNMGTMFYEKNCYSDLIAGVQQAAKANGQHVLMINVRGNHDTENPINENLSNVKVVTLTNSNPTIEAEGIKFVGVPYPLKTVWWPTLPKTPEDQTKVVGQQGDILAADACKYYAQDPNKPLVVIGHDHQMLAKTILKGCATLALDGHTHHASDIENYTGQNENIVMHKTVASASGAKVGFTPYDGPEQTASQTTAYFNTATSTFDAFVTTSLDTDGTANVTLEKPPSSSTPASQAPWISSFKQQYAKVAAINNIDSTEAAK